MESTALYIHIPFCKRSCFYCHFTKYPYEERLMDQYVHALATEARLRSSPAYQVASIYIGGGSPSLLNQRQFVNIVEAISQSFPLAPEVEFTVEMNPDDVTKNKLKFYQANHVNRLSLGTQSFIASDLEYLQRTHRAQQSLHVIQNILDLGFVNLNIDYMISLPGQDKKSLDMNFAYLERYPIPHVSVYLLEEVETNENDEIREERDHALYFFACKQLSQLGFNHYEISNFAKPGFCCQHNLRYWHNQSYIGLGVAAAGYLDPVDYKNTTQLNEYLDALAVHTLPPAEETRNDKNLRGIITGLRLLEGVPLSFFASREKELDLLLSDRWLEKRDSKIIIPYDKLLLQNEILAQLIG